MVQAQVYTGKDEAEINMTRAEKYIDEAASLGAELVCFPESFPGPWKDSNVYSPKERMARKAAEKKVYVICGDLEEAPGGYYNIFWFIGPDGKTIGKYRRTTPKGPWIYRGGKYWDFNYVSGNELPVFDTPLGKIGILMCSEVHVPELARIMALKGAEILFFPAGVTRRDVWETWGTLLKARAYENNAYAAMCRNMFEGDPGFCLVAGPEGPLLESHLPGVHLVEFDMDRLRWLRSTEDKYYETLPYRVKPGLLTQWRNPDLYEGILDK